MKYRDLNDPDQMPLTEYGSAQEHLLQVCAPFADEMLLLTGGCNMPSNSEQAPVLSALGILVGYGGAEAATDRIFERLLWPQT